MAQLLLSPPLAFLIFVGISFLIFGFGRFLAGSHEESDLKSSLYMGGEASEAASGAPGYRPFFISALFFAILHLGVLMFANGGFSWMTGVYLVGLMIALVALILG